MSVALAGLAAAYLARHPGDAARSLGRFTPRQAAALLESIAEDAAARVLSHVSNDDAARVLGELGDARLVRVLGAADFVTVAGWLAHLGDRERARVMGLLPAPFARDVEEALEFPPGTAGKLMDPRVVTFAEAGTAGEALERVRRLEGQSADELLVTDREGRLSGVVALRDLLVAAAGAPLGSIARRDRPTAHVMTSRDDVVELLRSRRLTSLPVLDVNGRVLGVLRHEELAEAAREEATDDLQQMVGAGKEERALSPPLFAVKSRLPWLVINLGTGFLAAAVVGLFDETIARVTALAVLMPVVAGQAGNTGAQALAVTLRGLSLREIRVSHFARVLTKETLATVVNGVAIALVTGAGTFFWSGSAALASVISVSMVGSMVIAAMAGATVPMVLTALKRDPATASSIILTTVTDVAGFSSFLGLASLLAQSLPSG